MSDLSIGIIETVTKNRPEIVFLPPALLGYIAYLQQNIGWFIVTGILIIFSALIHDIAEVIKEDGTYKANLGEYGNITRSFFLFSLFFFPPTSVFVLLYSIKIFYETYNIYIGIGISLYLVWIIKVISPLKEASKTE